ncbi:neurexin protein binding [Homalodisca vitripennis]|nr:neurexin protein binding [Homalodisca vitripennis]
MRPQGQDGSLYTQDVPQMDHTVYSGRVPSVCRRGRCVPWAAVRDCTSAVFATTTAPEGSWRGMRGVKSDRGFKPACPQRQPDGEFSKGRQELLRRALGHQSEDCLYLNIYSPSGPSSTKYPVLLFIQGERFEWSYGHLYDGSELASYGRLVVVTISYRLGILGFLNTNPGRRTVANFGLLDQIAALQWIQDNIHMFGGDAGSVTVLGHGSGAACVHWLMTSPAVPPGEQPVL